MTEQPDKMLAHLERIINNLNQHWHSIQLLLQHVSQPLLVDDRGLRSALCKITDKCLQVSESVEKLDISQTLSEIKFIGKRLDGIEKALSEMNEKGINKNIQLDFSVDGYQLVKKPVSYDRNDPIQEPKDDLKKLLDTLTEREAKVLVHRFGLFGEKKKTLKAIGLLFKVTSEPIRQIESKAIRKLRHPSRRNLVDKIIHKELKRMIIGDND